jgi:hypothetical protein
VRYDPADKAPITGSAADRPSWERDEPPAHGPVAARGYRLRLDGQLGLVIDRIDREGTDGDV